MTTHLEVSTEEHLNKTWSMLLKTKERLYELEATEDQNVTLKKDLAELQKQFEEVKHTAAKGQQAISSLNHLLGAKVSNISSTRLYFQRVGSFS